MRSIGENYTLLNLEDVSVARREHCEFEMKRGKNPDPTRNIKRSHTINV